MVEQIEVVQKWKPFIEETSAAGEADSAYQMAMTMVNVMALNIAAERCDEDEMIKSATTVAYTLKNIESDEHLDYSKRREMARDLVKHINEQRELFSGKCKCVRI